MTFGSLFAGIGGFDRGFELAGLECEWQVEIDDYANRILEKHWPDVRRGIWEGDTKLADAQGYQQQMQPSRADGTDGRERGHGESRIGTGCGSVLGGAAEGIGVSRRVTTEVSGDVADSACKSSDIGNRQGCTTQQITSRRLGSGNGCEWAVEPDVGRVAHGVPARVDRLRCLGNSIVPQVAEWIGRRIVEGQYAH